MKHKENIYKDRTFTISSAIGQGRLPHKATVVESYGHMCLCKIKKAYVLGGFDELAIFKIVKNGDGIEILQDAHIDYSSPGANVPSLYSAPDNEVMIRWDRIVSAAKVADSEADIISDRRKRENAEREATEKQIHENQQYIKARFAEIDGSLKESCNGKNVKKLATDKKIIALINEGYILEKIKSLINKR